MPSRAPMSQSHAGAGRAAPWSAALLDRLRRLGREVSLRKHQRIHPISCEGKTHYVVLSGTLVLEAPLRGGDARALLLLYPGDVYGSASAPDLPGSALTATTAARVLRVRREGLAPALACDGELALLLERCSGRLLARATLLNMAIASLTGDERAVCLLLEMAVHLGLRTGDTAVFSPPVSRRQMAELLALNPDTLSRIMSRLRTAGVIAAPHQGLLLIKSFDQLAATSPLSEAVLARSRDGQGLAAVAAARPSEDGGS